MALTVRELADKRLENLKEILNANHISLRKFSLKYYRDFIYQEATDSDCEKYYDCVKKMTDKPSNALERITALWRFALATYCNQPLDKHFALNQSAAWHWLVELKTRVSKETSSNRIGQPETALASVYSLFSTFRELSSNVHHKEFFFFVEPFVNGALRAFSTRWHAMLPIDESKTENFWQELELLQQTTDQHYQQLEGKFFPPSG
ncbi:hypothetical protein [Pelagibaculum spongiae]|uniref:Uncharacterized protein n=1 Tax=Pelagibaculum spongiae TaxID=2080658 RepID=A0A2V1H0L3_9GAMM|nr:hypothetical protein [Pelagibaculum spongiae]PVZ72013.1 hypothetical protein DC094_03055 [Pelagibaculum spongiae]